MTLLGEPSMDVAIVSNPSAWAARINAQWRQSLASVVEAGRILLEAKASLPHGQFTVMVETELDFNPRTAQRLMAIAQDERLSNPVHASVLPKAWTTLYELTTLTDEEFDRALAGNIIHPRMERVDVERIRQSANGEPAPAGGSAPASHMAGRVTPAGDLDFSPTPPWATRALVERVLAHLGLFAPGQACGAGLKLQTAWEPACGEGHMAEVLREYFRFVAATDIHDRHGYPDHIGDFLSPDCLSVPAGHFDWIITNPPFEDRVIKFMKRALELARVGVAMFLQLRYLEGLGRYEQVYRDNPPTIVAPFVERVPLLMGQYDPEASTTTAFMWLVWVKGMKPQAPFWIPPGCRKECARPDDVERFTQHPVTRRAA
jgi:hypothetical protein